MRQEVLIQGDPEAAQYSRNSYIALQFPSYHRWSIVMVELGQEFDCCVTRGYRPAIVLSQSSYNEVSPIMIIIPLTKQLKGIDRDYHVFIDKSDCSGYDSSGMALVEQLRPVDRRYVNRKVGEITEPYLKKKILLAVSNFLLIEEECL